MCPTPPGVYLWKQGTEALYAGKAKSLRKRMRQHTGGHDDRAMIPKMMARVDSFDYVTTTTEAESMILEANLIKELRPPYNVDVKDDKTFPCIALKYAREKQRPGTRYFGPYTDARAARETMEVVRRRLPTSTTNARRGCATRSAPCLV